MFLLASDNSVLASDDDHAGPLLNPPPLAGTLGTWTDGAGASRRPSGVLISLRSTDERLVSFKTSFFVPTYGS